MKRITGGGTRPELFFLEPYPLESKCQLNICNREIRTNLFCVYWYLIDASGFQAFEDLEDLEGMPETEEQDEKRLNKRTQQMQLTLKSAFHYSQQLSFKDMTRNHNRKQAASRFYTLLVLKKHQVVEVEQSESFGDILISEGPHFGRDC